MAEHLVVVSPFGDYATGHLITDPAEVDACRRRVGFVVAVTAPDLNSDPAQPAQAAPVQNTEHGED